MADNMIMLKKVRVSFPHLYEPPVINGEVGKCGATFMLEPDKHKNELQKLKTEIETLRKGDKLKGAKLPPDKICLRIGNDTGRAEYEGYMTLSANSKSAPMVVNNAGNGIIKDEKDCPIYAGCYVNAKVQLWAQNNQYGKRINASLVSIQFADDGEPLDGSYVSMEEAIEGFDDTEDNEDFLD